MRLCCHQIQKRYKIAALQYKRIESVTRSPIYSHCSESLGGLSTIRAYDTRAEAEAKNAKVTNVNTQATFIMRVAERWLSMRLEGIGNLIVLVAGMMGVASKGSGVYSGYIGIALVYGMRITQMLSWAVRSSTELSVNMNSVERILHYVDHCDPEQPRATAGKLERVPANWPSAGAVHFDKLSMRYRPGLELVLKGLDFAVKGGETVGICGRTGAVRLKRLVSPAILATVLFAILATVVPRPLSPRVLLLSHEPLSLQQGKSSLMLALFRMIEPASGAIRIDGVDISKISLYDLRSRLSIIPQDPVPTAAILPMASPCCSCKLTRSAPCKVLFSGTVRFNLDPTDNVASDDVLWTVLSRVHLDAKIRSLDGGLDASVSEHGESFSVGQRQLVCMARALLRRSQVLLMDEATSSVDIDTDRQIQELIREEFKHQTILTIAHRLNTIIDYDTIVVIESGRVAEIEAPRVLLTDPTSKFSSLVASTGADNDAKLREMIGMPALAPPAAAATTAAAAPKEETSQASATSEQQDPAAVQEDSSWESDFEGAPAAAAAAAASTPPQEEEEDLGPVELAPTASQSSDSAVGDLLGTHARRRARRRAMAAVREAFPLPSLDPSTAFPRPSYSLLSRKESHLLHAASKTQHPFCRALAGKIDQALAPSPTQPSSTGPPSPGGGGGGASSLGYGSPPGAGIAPATPERPAAPINSPSAQKAVAPARSANPSTPAQRLPAAGEWPPQPNAASAGLSCHQGGPDRLGPDRLGAAVVPRRRQGLPDPRGGSALEHSGPVTREGRRQGRRRRRPEPREEGEGQEEAVNLVPPLCRPTVGQLCQTAERDDKSTLGYINKSS